MVSFDKDGVDFKVLLENLDAAVESERIYNLQNEAKIRAVNERGTTYEDFVNAVKGATLKPVDKGDKLYCNPRHKWNPVAQKTEDVSIDDILKSGNYSASDTSH